MVDIVHSSTGRGIRPSEAKALARDWDANSEEALGCKDFLRLLLSERIRNVDVMISLEREMAVLTTAWTF